MRPTSLVSHFIPPTWSKPGRLFTLLFLTILLEALFNYFNLPAALLLGSMIAGIIIATFNAGLSLPKPVFAFCQGIIGIMIAGGLPASIFNEIAAQWPAFVIGILSTLVVSIFLGWLLTRTGLLPGTTAIWGSFPGAASVMTLMSESYGADMRLVAFMQYLRVICCVLVATLIASLFHTHTIVQPVQWLAVSSWSDFAITLIVTLLTVLIGVFFRIPGGAVIVSLLAGLVLTYSGIMTIELPNWFLAICFSILGWGIGFRFTRASLRYAFNILPHVLGAIFVLILLNLGFALLLIFLVKVDPLTAFLATSPGGAEYMAIIAASSNADTGFVMSMQIGRFFLILFVGPSLAQWLSKNSRHAGI